MSKNVMRCLKTIACGLICASFQGCSPQELPKASEVPSLPGVLTSVEHVAAIGRLEPSSRLIRLEVPSGNEGSRIEKLLVHEGQDIRAGDVVATTDAAERRSANVAVAQANLEVAQSRLVQIKAGAKSGEIAAAEAAVRIADQQQQFSQKELERALALKGTSAMSQEEIEQRRHQYASGNEELNRAKSMLASVSEVRSVDVAVQESLVLAADASLRMAQAEWEATQVKSTLDGRVLRIHAWPGEKASALGLLELGQVQEMHAVAEVYEADIAKVVVGQTAEVVVEANEKQLKGTVVEIGNMVARKVVLTNDPVSDTDARIVEVRIRIDSDDRALVEGMTNARIRVRIHTEQKD